jgi:putative DNA primase/helicase
MRPVELILSKLPDATSKGAGWMARCPAHEDQRASLSIGVGDDGRALLHCHAGCTPEAVVTALGLKLTDLMPVSSGKPSRSVGARSTIKAKRARRCRKDDPTVYAIAEDAIAALERKLGAHTAAWTFHDAHGEPVGVIVRWDVADGKEIRPVSKTAKGWIIGGMPEPRPLYRLPDLLARPDERVYVTEGEKAADAAATIGLLATTSPHGSKSAVKADWTPLAGHEVVILPDNDAAGRRYAKDVVAILAKLEPAPKVKLVDLPELPEKGDIYDWLEEHDALERETLRAIVEGLADDAPIVDRDRVTDGPILTCLADVEPTEIKWLWFQRVPLGRITLLVGMPGEGKSFLTTYMASRVSTGSPWPDGTECPRGSVIFICAEDDPADTIRPRLDAHHADVRRIHLLATVRKGGDKDEAKEVMFTLADVDALETALKRHPDCKLVVVDPIGSFLGGRTDAHRDNEVRGVLAPVAKLAEKYGVAVVVVAHRRKAGGAVADDLALGSRAFTGIARAVWHLTHHPEKKSLKLLLPGKNNLARQNSGLGFTISGNPPAIWWERGEVDMSADDALAADNAAQGKRPGPEPKARNKAAEWLQDFLRDGPMRAGQIKDDVKEAGYAWRTVERAKDDLGIKPYREQFGGAWMWKLPLEGTRQDSGKT